jgi:hypothetical protein
MKPECIRALRAAAAELGRDHITDAQIAEIDARLQRTMRTLARTEEGWQALSADQRLQAAAQRAMEDIRAEAARKVTNAEIQVLKTAAVEHRIAELGAQFKGDKRAELLVRDFEHASAFINGIKAEAMGGLMRLMDAVKSGDDAGAGRRVAMFLFDAENPRMTRDLAAEVLGGADGSSGNGLAREGAKAWLQTIETLRQRFNAAGGDVGRLDYGYLPQPHDHARVRQAGRARWVADMMGKLDRGRYVDEAGAQLGDVQMQQVLGGIFDTISTDGLNKLEPGRFAGTGARANRGMEHRELHFKDAEAYTDYMARYGRGGMYDAMVGHVGRMARDIGLVERYGPNPNAQMRLQFDLARKADGTPEALTRTFGVKPEGYWDVLNGTASTPESARLAQIGTDVRNVMTMGKLAGAVISSITDIGTYALTTGFNRLNYWDSVANIGRTAASADARRFLTAHGVIAESMIGDLNRWSGDHLAQTWSGRLAQSTLKLSLLNAWTDTLRRAFSLTMMQGMARLAKVEWAKLSEWDRTHLERGGITEADWGVVTRAELTRFQGMEHLTPEAIRGTGDARANEAVAKVLGFIQHESETAVLNPDLATKAMVSMGGTQRGTVKGELARSVMQFKSFPLAMISRHWRRMLDMPTVSDGSAPMAANRLMYAGALMLTSTALGAIALQAKQVVAGKDPIDMRGEHAAKFWAKAVAQGGGLSIAGDMLLNDPGYSTSDAMRSFFGTLAGPAVSTAAQGTAIAVEGAWAAAKGKNAHTAADTLNLARQNLPFVNLWYAKAALDHAGMHALQENLSPGYLGRMRQRAAKDWGQDYWWQPGTGAPDRAPDLARAVGQ